MKINGKIMAQEIEQELRGRVAALAVKNIFPGLGIILVGDNPMSIKYVGFKQALGERIGAKVEVVRLPVTATFEMVAEVIEHFNRSENINGIIVQLGLPKPLDERRDEVLKLIDPAKDVDALTERAIVWSPVVASMKAILEKAGLIHELIGKKAVVIGRGQLVGLPAKAWLEGLGMQVVMTSSKTSDDEREALTREADVIVAGAGKPGLIKPDAIKDGVILLDGSTSDVNGSTVGDIDEGCFKKARLYTPVPGGVGPLTVVMLFSNLLDLIERRL